MSTVQKQVTCILIGDSCCKNFWSIEAAKIGECLWVWHHIRGLFQYNFWTWYFFLLTMTPNQLAIYIYMVITDFNSSVIKYWLGNVYLYASTCVTFSCLFLKKCRIGGSCHYYFFTSFCRYFQSAVLLCRARVITQDPSVVMVDVNPVKYSHMAKHYVVRHVVVNTVKLNEMKIVQV